MIQALDSAVIIRSPACITMYVNETDPLATLISLDSTLCSLVICMSNVSRLDATRNVQTSSTCSAAHDRTSCLQIHEFVSLQHFHTSSSQNNHSPSYVMITKLHHTPDRIVVGCIYHMRPVSEYEDLGFETDITIPTTPCQHIPARFHMVLVIGQVLDRPGYWRVMIVRIIQCFLL